MSSLSLFNSIPTDAIETLFDSNNQPWFKQVDVGDYIGFGNIRQVTSNLPVEDKKHRSELTVRPTDGSCQVSKSAKPHDGFISLNGLTAVIMNSRKPKARVVSRWLIQNIIPRGFNKMIEEVAEKHQKTIKEKEDKIQAIQYENVGLQGEMRAKDQQIVRCENRIGELRERYVDHCKNPKKDNIVIIIRKHSTVENDIYHKYPYYIARIQKQKRYIKLHWFDKHFPEHEVVVELDTPNAIHAFNRFEEEGHVERRYNHFSLIDLTRDNLYDMGIPAVLEG